MYRLTGDYAIAFWIMIAGNVIAPLLLVVKIVRTTTKALFIIAILINIGMWLERFVIIVTSLAHEYVPFAWGIYKPTWVEVSITAGSFAWFGLWFLLFVKLFPVVSLTEVKELVDVS